MVQETPFCVCLKICLNKHGLILKNDHQWWFMFISRTQIRASTRGMRTFPPVFEQMWAVDEIADPLDHRVVECFVWWALVSGVYRGPRRREWELLCCGERTLRCLGGNPAILLYLWACKILRNCACADGQGSGATDSQFEVYSCSSRMLLAGAVGNWIVSPSDSCV